MRRKILVFCSSILFLAAFLAGCGGKNDSITKAEKKLTTNRALPRSRRLPRRASSTACPS